MEKSHWANNLFLHKADGIYYWFYSQIILEMFNYYLAFFAEGDKMVFSQLEESL